MVALPDGAVVENHVQRRPEPALVFDFEDGTRARAVDVHLHLGFHVPLGEPHQHREEVRNALAGLRGHRDDADVRLEVLDAPVEVRGEPRTGELADELVQRFVELAAHAVGLVLVGLLDGRVLRRVPARNGVDFVRGDDERRPRVLEDADGFLRLGLEAVVDVHHEDGDVRERAAPRAQRRERVVAGRVDEQQPGEVELRRVDEAPRDLADDVQRHRGRADVLGDGAGFALDDGGAANLVEQASLPVVDVAEDRDDGRPQLPGVFGGVCVGHSRILRENGC